MQCPSCGTACENDIPECLECGAPAVVSESNANDNPKRMRGRPRRSAKAGTETKTTAQKQTKRSSTLIDFPGVSRSSVPKWRKEVSERVRELHEKRAREAALEAAQLEQQRNERAGVSPPQLALLSQGDRAPVNPLVEAALRRIERANHAAPQDSSHAAPTVAMAPANADADSHNGDHQPLDLTVASSPAADPGEPSETPSAGNESAPSDKVHNLVVVARNTSEANSSQSEVTLEAEVKAQAKRNPRRVITEDLNQPALNYLDSIPTATRIGKVRYPRAPAVLRLMSAAIDLSVVGLLCVPFSSLMKFSDEAWPDWRVMIIVAAVFSIVAFFYLTISTALTGRTMGMRLLSLRVVDERTGMIPTGSQSAGRALLYVATLLTLGIATVYALVDPERRPAHDRLTRTAVIRD